MGGGKAAWEKKSRESQRRRIGSCKPVVEAYGRPGVNVVREQVMQRANITDSAEFLAMAEYLYRRGWIADADADYGIFALTLEGIDEALD